MDVQAVVGVEDEEKLAVVAAAEVSPPAGAQVPFNQVRAQGLAAQRLGHVARVPWAAMDILEQKTGLAKNQLRIC
jgi:hypothetical protein